MIEKMNAVDVSGTSEFDSTARFRVKNSLIRRRLRFKKMSGAIYLIQNTTFEIGGNTPESLLQYVRKFPNEFVNGNTLIHMLVRLESLVTPAPDGVWPNKCFPNRSIARY